MIDLCFVNFDLISECSLRIKSSASKMTVFMETLLKMTIQYIQYGYRRNILFIKRTDFIRFVQPSIRLQYNNNISNQDLIHFHEKK